MTAATPLVSVVIPTRNRVPFLREAVASVLTQSLHGIELVVVDDASADGTWAWLEREQDDRLRPIRLDRHAERSKARNRGLAAVRGDFVMFLDDDDRLRPQALERLASLLAADSAAIAVVGARWRFVEWGDAVRIPHPRRPARRVIWPELLFGWSAGSGQVLYRTAVVRQVGGYREDLDRREDRDLWLRVARMGPVLLDPSVAVEYRVHLGQTPWPPEGEELWERVLAPIMQSLTDEERSRARRIRIAWRASARAERAFWTANYGQAIAWELRAIRAAPSLYRSPLILRPRFVRLVRSARRLLGGPPPSGRMVER